MSNALNKLDAKVAESVKAGTASKNMSRDQLLDYMSNSASMLRSQIQFFTDCGPILTKLQTDLMGARKAAAQSLLVQVWNKIDKGLTGAAKLRQESGYFGAVVESMQATVSILEEVSANVDKLFVDKNFNLYNTKISHVAIYGVIDSAEVLANYSKCLISAIMADRNPTAFGLVKYQKAFLMDKADDIAGICTRMINGKLGKTFTAGVLRYKQSGDDVCVLTTDNQSSAKFAKIGTGVNEEDVKRGCRGLYIFRWIGDRWTDLFDWIARLIRSLREQNKARVEYLQMELDGENQDSPRYKKIVQVIKNYNDQIARMDQYLEKYYNED
jgi:hypothetical protein